MIRSARRLPHLNAEAINNGLDWLTAQRYLYQAGRTPFATIYRGDACCVRHYAGRPGGQTAPPIVLVPPLAVQADIFDLLPQRSLVRHLCDCGFNVYLLAWDAPSRDLDHLGLADYALSMLPAALQAIRNHGNCQQLSLLGYCMGGLFALLHAGTGRDAGIANIVTIATPVDLHADTFAATLAHAGHKPARKLRLHKLSPALFHVPGPLNALAFKLASPGSAVTATFKLLHHLDHQEYVAAHATMRAWLNHMDAYPGALMQDLMNHVWLENRLADGSLHLGNQETDLVRIDCPLLTIAGADDPLVGQASTRKLIDRARSADATQLIAPGGHVGVLAGARAPEYCWPRIVNWLTSRSCQVSGNAGNGTPADASSEAVSCSGKPMTPE